jgi:hypothetical protein
MSTPLLYDLFLSLLYPSYIDCVVLLKRDFFVSELSVSVGPNRQDNAPGHVHHQRRIVHLVLYLVSLVPEENVSCFLVLIKAERVE